MPKKNRDENREEMTENIASEETINSDEQMPDVNDVGFDEENDVYAKIQEELTTERDKHLRLAAEYDNYRKRSQKEREALFADVKADTIAQLLPVYDNLERALKQKCTDEAFYKGIEMTMTQLLEIFKKMGVELIPAIGETFDPDIHNAVMHVHDENVQEGVIVEEFQKGFTLGDKVIRFSMVSVAN